MATLYEQLRIIYVGRHADKQAETTIEQAQHVSERCALQALL